MTIDKIKCYNMNLSFGTVWWRVDILLPYFCNRIQFCIKTIWRQQTRLLIWNVCRLRTKHYEWNAWHTRDILRNLLSLGSKIINHPFPSHRLWTKGQFMILWFITPVVNLRGWQSNQSQFCFQRHQIAMILIVIGGNNSSLTYFRSF